MKIIINNETIYVTIISYEIWFWVFHWKSVQIKFSISIVEPTIHFKIFSHRKRSDKETKKCSLIKQGQIAPWTNSGDKRADEEEVFVNRIDGVYMCSSHSLIVSHRFHFCITSSFRCSVLWFLCTTDDRTLTKRARKRRTRRLRRER